MSNSIEDIINNLKKYFDKEETVQCLLSTLTYAYINEELGCYWKGNEEFKIAIDKVPLEVKLKEDSETFPFRSQYDYTFKTLQNKDNEKTTEQLMKEEYDKQKKEAENIINNKTEYINKFKDNFTSLYEHVLKKNLSIIDQDTITYNGKKISVEELEEISINQLAEDTYNNTKKEVNDYEFEDYKRHVEEFYQKFYENREYEPVYIEQDILYNSLVKKAQENKNITNDYKKAMMRLENLINKNANMDFKIELEFINDEKGLNNTICNLLTSLGVYDASKDCFENLSKNNDLAFESLVENICKNRRGRITTSKVIPVSIKKLISEIISKEEQKYETLYNPSCNGDLLLYTLTYNPKSIRKGYGQHDKIPPIVKSLGLLDNILCKMSNKGSYYYNEITLKEGDIFEEDQFKDKTFDVLVTKLENRKWNPKEPYLEDPRFKNKDNVLASKRNSNYAYMQHMLHHMNQKGIMIIIASSGLLSLSGSEEIIRTNIIGQYIDTIIKLPDNLHLYKTPFPSEIIIFKKSKKDKSILFIDLTLDFKDRKGKIELGKEDIHKIMNTYLNRTKSEKDHYSHLAPIEDIKKYDYNLNVRLYVDTYQSEKIPLETIKSNLEKVERKLKINDKKYEELIKNTWR